MKLVLRIVVKCEHLSYSNDSEYWFSSRFYVFKNVSVSLWIVIFHLDIVMGEHIENLHADKKPIKK